MVEYGHGVGEVAGRTGGGSGVGGGTTDLGAGLAQLVNDSVNTIAAMPPELLLVAALAVIVGIALLKRAF
jgi:hypothetical protein